MTHDPCTHANSNWRVHKDSFIRVITSYTGGISYVPLQELFNDTFISLFHQSIITIR